MQKLFLISIIFSLIISGCNTTKQTQHIVKDSVVNRSPGVVLKPVDSNEIIKEQLSTVINAPLNFTTFYGRAKAYFNSPQQSGNATVYIKMKKDSAIWISITYLFNIEVARILVTPDSLKIINKLEGSVELTSIAHLQQITKLPLGFNDFQNIILGRPVLVDSMNLNYEFKKDSITVADANDLLKYFYSFTRNNFQLGQSNFQTVNNSVAITANIFYNGYSSINGINFSSSRDIAVTGPSPANLQLSFKEYNFNQPQTFLFTISKNYTIKYD